jgi:menaquinone-dependent protoporphyrinogen oxidase
MKPVGVFYATREGHTGRIAEFVAKGLRARGFKTDVRNLAEGTDIDLTNYQAAVLAASVHAGKHESEMTRFVKKHHKLLDAVPTAFLSVTLSEAGAERVNATPDERARFAAGVDSVIDGFFSETGWHPGRVKPVAGALLYSKYNVLVRFIMKRIARKAGGDTDTSHDYEYTDWRALERFIDEFSTEISYTAVAA